MAASADHVEVVSVGKFLYNTTVFKSRTPMFIAGLVLLTIMVGGVLVFLRPLFPSPDSSVSPSSPPINSVVPPVPDGYQSYHNLKYGYSFNYPSNLEFRDPVDNPDLALAQLVTLVDPNQPDPDAYLLQILGVDIMTDVAPGWTETTMEPPLKFTRKYVNPDPDNVLDIYQVLISHGGVVIYAYKEAPSDLVQNILSSFTFPPQP